MLEQVAPLYETLHMQADYKQTLPHSFLFFRDANQTLYCKYIASAVYSCSMDYLEQGDYANIIEFDMVYDDHTWQILQTNIRDTFPYDADTYQVCFVPDTQASKIRVEPDKPLFSWTYDNIDAFILRMQERQNNEKNTE